MVFMDMAQSRWRNVLVFNLVENTSTASKTVWARIRPPDIPLTKKVIINPLGESSNPVITISSAVTNLICLKKTWL